MSDTNWLTNLSLVTISTDDKGRDELPYLIFLIHIDVGIVVRKDFLRNLSFYMTASVV
jgi:hypothetical protein